MTKIRVRVIPNKKHNEMAGFKDGAWIVCLAAPPVEGRANAALIKFLADKLDLAPSQIEIKKGFSSKTKLLDIPISEKQISDSLGQ